MRLNTLSSFFFWVGLVVFFKNAETELNVLHSGEGGGGSSCVVPQGQPVAIAFVPGTGKLEERSDRLSRCVCVSFSCFMQYFPRPEKNGIYLVSGREQQISAL